MGIYNSAETRVRRILGQLAAEHKTDVSWAVKLWALARGERQAVEPPSPSGTLKRELLERDPRTNLLRVFERPVPPPTAFLRWLVLNPDRMSVPNRETFGTSAENEAREKRRDLFSIDVSIREAAQREAFAEIERLGGRGSSRKWWAFEGFTYVDCCIETETMLLFIEGKRTEPVSPSTRWFAQRNQVWRNVEAASEMAEGRAFGVILAVEREAEEILRHADASRDASLPHLDAATRTALGQHLFGAVTWERIVEVFELSPDLLST